MNTWRPEATKIMQQFFDFDNEGFVVSKCLFDIVQNSKLCLMTCKEVYLFQLKYTDWSSAANGGIRSVENYIPTSLPETFEELIKVPLDRPYTLG